MVLPVGAYQKLLFKVDEKLTYQKEEIPTNKHENKIYSSAEKCQATKISEVQEEQDGTQTEEGVSYAALSAAPFVATLNDDSLSMPAYSLSAAMGISSAAAPEPTIGPVIGTGVRGGPSRSPGSLSLLPSSSSRISGRCIR